MPLPLRPRATFGLALVSALLLGGWASEYAKVKMLGDDLVNKELVVEAKSGFVVAGWNSGFSDERGITVSGRSAGQRRPRLRTAARVSRRAAGQEGEGVAPSASKARFVWW
ncbi:hypothetical protein GCM10009802_01440 [Streptomyces synnematoformans]|uniref:Uncharacterized protein n=1 Tax=Streptomyces synnematoformans TaxID=415721 RepID=A0ABN2X8N5_9ACTN